MSRNRIMRMKGGNVIHLDLNSHNISGSTRNRTTGGKIVLEQLKPHNPVGTDPVPPFRQTGKILKSSNWMLDDLTTNDISDLKAMFGSLTQNQIDDAKKVDRVKQATLKRVADSVKKVRSLKPRFYNVRGTVANKKMRLKKKKLI